MNVAYITIKNHNFGDALNTPILRSISTFDIHYFPYWEVGYRPYVNQYDLNVQRISAIGSIAHLWTGYTMVWGSGILYPDMKYEVLDGMMFYVVRGPKTRKILLDIGYKDIPEVYCDPGVIAPYAYESILSNTKKYKYGVVFHHCDNINAIICNPFFRRKDVLIINTLNPCDIVIRQISMCERIISSSLHGIIVAEAMNIPTSCFRASDINNTFKFDDYFESTGRYDVHPTDIRAVAKNTYDFEKMTILPKPTFDISGLIDHFPYTLKPNIKINLLSFYRIKGVNVK